MKPSKRLVLRRERLARIDGPELRSVGGATHLPTDCGCLTHGYSCEVCPVVSLPVNQCITMVMSAVADICSC